MTEGKLHFRVAQYLDGALPSQTTWFPIPNGMKARGVAVSRMKARREIRPGVPDICIIHKGRSIFIELKTPDGAVSDTQTEVMQALTLAGAVCTVCRSLDEVAAFLQTTIGITARVT